MSETVLPASSMRRQPQQNRSQQKVESLLIAAAEVFAEVGYESATTQMIAIRAKAAIGSLYQFFPDKLAIFHALEARHMDQIMAMNAQLLEEILFLPIDQMVDRLVETHAAYFQHPIPRIVYLQYFITPHLFALFNESINWQMIQQAAEFYRQRNPALTVQKSECLSEVIHHCYSTIVLRALQSDEVHRQALYTELKALITSYLKFHESEKSGSQVMKVMKCPTCSSQQLSKNGHRHNKQRYRCKTCGRQFLVAEVDTAEL